jgi:hypothetical protein
VAKDESSSTPKRRRKTDPPVRKRRIVHWLLLFVGKLEPADYERTVQTLLGGGGERVAARGRPPEVGASQYHSAGTESHRAP